MAYEAVSYSELKKKLENVKNNVARYKDDAKRIAGESFKVAEVAAGAGACGYVNARYGKNGELDVANVPVDLGLGAALALVGVLDLAGKEYSTHLVNLGAGCLASYCTRKGADYGAKALAKAGGSATSSGYLPPNMGRMGADVFQREGHAVSR